VEGRVVTPPALPFFVGPGTADRAEHVAADHYRAEVRLRVAQHVVAGAALALVPAAVHLVERGLLEGPLVEGLAAFAEWVLLALVRARHVAVE
jgi:hypothetical protein